MLKRQSKVLSIALIFVFCMSFMFAGFAAPNVAEAVSTYTLVKTESVSQTNVPLTQPKIAIEIPDAAALGAGDLVTIHLPSGLKMDNPGGTVGAVYDDPKVSWKCAAGELALDIVTPSTNASTPTYNGPITTKSNVLVDAPASLQDGTTLNALNALGAFVAYPIGDSAIEIKIAAAGLSGKALLYVNLQNVLVEDSFDGDIKARIVAPTNSGFSSGEVVVAKYISSGKGTVATAKSVVSMGDETKTLDTIMIQEVVKGAIKSNDKIQLKLDNGFKWVLPATASVKGSWEFSGVNLTGVAGAPAAGQFGLKDNRTLILAMPAALSNNNDGRFYITGVQIAVDDDSVAKKGEVNVNISNSVGDGVTDQDIVVANYADYGVTVEEVKVAEVVAGLDATELGSFRIKEDIANSILHNRVITLTLPEGVKWMTNSGAGGAVWPDTGTSNVVSLEWEKGDLSFTANNPTTTSNNGRTLKFTVGTPTAPATSFAKTSIVFKKLQTTIAPNFNGDINVEIAGSAGVTGTVKVATVKSPVEMTTDGGAKIVIGSQGQKAADIVITENKKEAIKSGTGTNKIILRLPNGASWTQKPEVSVTEGDLTIDSVSSSGTDVTITTKSASSKASTIKVSNIAVTTDRTVPEGDFKVKIVGATTTAAAATPFGSTALTDNAWTDRFDVPSIASVVIGQCVTPAPGEGTEGAASGQFRISSNIYEVNGVAKVMDVAPYIKNNRTYVPVRYLGYALGVADADVVWDAAAQKATLTKGDNVVELTIGSTTITVNGEAQTMDVAPEIVNNRTMLPARYVAEGLGYVVGWDPGTKTVLISK